MNCEVVGAVGGESIPGRDSYPSAHCRSPSGKQPWGTFPHVFAFPRLSESCNRSSQRPSGHTSVLRQPLHCLAGCRSLRPVSRASTGPLGLTARAPTAAAACSSSSQRETCASGTTVSSSSHALGLLRELQETAQSLLCYRGAVSLGRPHRVEKPLLFLPLCGVLCSPSICVSGSLRAARVTCAVTVSGAVFSVGDSSCLCTTFCML